jgi:hypothetical protein
MKEIESPTGLPLMNKLDGIYIAPTFTITFAITLHHAVSHIQRQKLFVHLKHICQAHTYLCSAR